MSDLLTPSARILSLIMAEPDLVDDPDFQVLPDEAFGRDIGLVRAVRKLVLEGTRPSPVNLAAYFRRTGTRDTDNVGSSRLTQLAENPPFLETLNDLSNLAIEAYEREELDRRLGALKSANLNGESAATVQDRIASELLGFSVRRPTRTIHDIASAARLRRFSDAQGVQHLMPGLTEAGGVPLLENSQLITLGALTKMGKCLAGGAIVEDATTGSTQTIREMVRRGLTGETFTVHAFDEARGRMTTASVEGYLPSGNQEVFRLRLSSGREVTATANHPFLTGAGWTPLSQIQVGDQVATPARTAITCGIKRSIPYLKMLGFLVGDGYMGQVKAGVMVTAPDWKAKVILDEGAEVLGLWARRNEQADRNTPTFQLVRKMVSGLAASERGNPLNAHLAEMGLLGCLSADKFVPEYVFESDDDAVAAFLYGLFSADGSLDVRNVGSRVGVEFYSVSNRLCVDVMRLLARLGIDSRLSRKRGSYLGETHWSWRVLVQPRDNVCFLERVGINRPNASEALTAARSVNSYGVPLPKEAMQEIDLAIWEIGESKAAFARRTKIKSAAFTPLVSGHASSTQLTVLAPHLPVAARWLNDLRWEWVESVEAVGVEDTYDIQVAGHHNFVADGILVHNSIFVQQLVDNVAVVNGEPVFYAALETNDEQALDQMCAARARIPGNLRGSELSQDEKQRWDDASLTLQASPLEICQTKNIFEIIARIKATKPKLAVIDQLSHLRGLKRERNESTTELLERYVELVRDRIALAMDIPVVLVFQLNRLAEGRRPTLGDVKNTASIAEWCDEMWFLYRESYTSTETLLIRELTRHGAPGDFRMTFNGALRRFV